MKLELSITNAQRKVAFNRGKIERIIKAAFKKEKMNVPAKVNLWFTTDKGIQKLNARYLRENCPTDVIAFELARDKKEIIADIAISSDTAAANAKLYRTSPVNELYLYVAHAILHILGYRDNTEAKRKTMQKKAEQILSKCPSIKPKP